MDYYPYPEKTPFENGMYIVVCRNDYGRGPENVHCLNTWTDGKWDVGYTNIVRFSDRIDKFTGDYNE